ncbi:glutamine-hydrolyzing GMP synthase [Candidatus Peregrinibacteria bacterium]|nr:glutamine-hydrolyzing GMP synthase [Candidatus Peregrinibacteria bacterium]MBT4366840.1 glutamine-hydrolyzing GMP synthase [Candidatus Peregrinibacteria bacterium]MBT6731191.1 glutamine-hydrolyzing GMP synthase [Candidatus Peregrinibacteria bacterium]MBT7009231.1 glutamine-hydrolyzing GMP synthase [Candidatus Peregrinibacteria bacterium]MBT7344512.1 glutamine-hydrolyzing GMP synthase [Candidatus Peregrinibacteria bacterium]
MSTIKGSIVILDFGGQYAHLISSRVRRLGAFTQILEPETSAELLKDAAGIILSGGPQSVYDENSPKANPKIFDLGIPVLGICYGLQYITKVLGGEVSQGKVKEYGSAKLSIENTDVQITKDLPNEITVWMSHGDEATRLPEGFERFGTSDSCANAAFADVSRNFYAIQFHPEVTHTEHGNQILNNFVECCNTSGWSMNSYKENVSTEILKEVGDRNVFMLVSGGVDSSVAFTLLNNVLGADRVQGLLVDTGLMRKDEVAEVKDAFDKLGITNLRVEDASEEFFAKLEGVYEPEEKRKIIGQTFLDVQKRVSEQMGLSIEDGWILGQGTIYPDTIETGATKHADKIKTHHNRVDAVQKMIDEGLVIEPLKDLYKDEVRELGEELGLPHDFVWRHPFPGPGLGVRILCAEKVAFSPSDNAPVSLVPDENNKRVKTLPINSVGVQGDGRTYRLAQAMFSDERTPNEFAYRTAVSAVNSLVNINRMVFCTSHSEATKLKFTSGYITPERAELLREADAIADEEMKNAGLYEEIWQFPVVLLPFGENEGGQSIVLRPIDSKDAMSASAVVLPPDVLKKMTNRILDIEGIDMVFIDLTNKPPGTIEWE